MLTPDFVFIHTVTVRRYLGYDVTSAKYGEPEELRCRVNLSRSKTNRVTDRAAQEIVGEGTIFFSAGVRMEPESEITFDDRTYKVLSCMPSYDFSGENHVEVEIK